MEVENIHLDTTLRGKFGQPLAERNVVAEHQHPRAGTIQPRGRFQSQHRLTRSGTPFDQHAVLIEIAGHESNLLCRHAAQRVVFLVEIAREIGHELKLGGQVVDGRFHDIRIERVDRRPEPRENLGDTQFQLFVVLA